MSYTNRSLLNAFNQSTLRQCLSIGLVLLASCALSLWLINDADTTRRIKSETLLTANVSNNLWHYDIASIQNELKAYRDLWQAVAIVVTDKYGTKIIAGNNTDTDLPDKSYQLFSEDNKQIGTLDLWSKPTPLLTHLWHPVTLLHIVVWLLSSGMIILFNRQLYSDRLLPQLKQLYSDITQDASERQLPPPQTSYLSDLTSLRIKIADLRNQNIQYENQIEQRLAQTELESEEIFDLLKQTDITFLITDHTGEILSESLNYPFTRKDSATLRGTCNGELKLPYSLQKIGFFPTSADCMDAENQKVRCLFESISGEFVHVYRIDLSNQRNALIIDSPKDTQWQQISLGQFLGELNAGHVVFSDNGEIRIQLGLPVARLLTDPNAPINPTLSDFLLQFPRIEVLEPNSAIVFEHSVSPEQIYRIRLLKNYRHWISMAYQEITEERDAALQLRENRKLRELADLTSGVAHDFNNSLGVMIGQLELALLQNPGTRLQENMETALAAANQSAKVVSQLMAYSKNQPLKPRVFSLDKRIEQDKAVFISALGNKHKLLLSLDSGASVYLDPEKFSSAMLNVVINAKDHMLSPGTVTIRTSQHKTLLADNKQVIVEIVDTGGGIPPTIIEKVFDPFFTTKPIGRGSGLGLSMVRGLIEQSSGTIEVENTEEGALFKITLPIVELDQNLVQNQENTNGKESRALNESLKVMLVDDDEALLATQRAVLQQFGVTVIGFYSCTEALSYVSNADSNDLDCCIIDLRMPDMHGFDLVGAIREIYPQLSIIIWSGNLDDKDIKKARALGIEHCLTKPTPSSLLFDTLQSVATENAQLQGRMPDGSPDSYH